MMKVAMGGFVHESNSFSKEYTDLEMFKEWTLSYKDTFIQTFQNKRNRILGGCVDYAEQNGWEIIPLIGATACPSGPVTNETYNHIKGEILQNLNGKSLDGVILHLHGAAVAQGYDDCEGDLLTEVRKVVGKDVPVLVILDLHANVSDKMVKMSDVILGYNTQPHVDLYQREWEAAEILQAIACGNVKPLSVRTQPPLLISGHYTDTSKGPMKEVMDRAFDWEKAAGVINVSPFAGYYGSDKYEAGPSVVVTTNDDLALAERIAKDMAEFIWKEKERFYPVLTPVEEAVERSQKEGGLWAFIDKADDPLGGGPGDGTFILQKLIDLGVHSAGVAAIHDPIVARKAHEVGLGGRVTGFLGALKDKLHGDPIKLDAKVVGLLDQKIPLAYWDESVLQNIGKAAVLDQDGILIVVSELKAATENIDIFHYFNIDVSELSILVLKGLSHAYEAVYKDLPKEYILVESIGITNPDVTKIGDFQKIRKPIYPFDPDTEFSYR